MKDHTKSRRGCHQCKQRKVKCDETLPCCKRCHRRREACSYLHEFGPGGSPSDRSADHYHLHPAPSHGGSSCGSPSPAEPPTYPIDLELTHFFLIHTYKTLWGRDEARLVWRDVIFPSSINHPPLRDGIFAMAAMHRLMTSDLTPEQRSLYRSTALVKQTAALRGFVPLLHAIDDCTAEVAMPMSILVAHWAFASLSLPPELNILSLMDVSPSLEAVPSFAIRSALNQFLELIRRVQPIHHVIDQAPPSLSSGPLSTLMATPDPRDLPDLSQDTQNALDTLRRHLDVVPEVRDYFRDEFWGKDPIDSLVYMFRLSLRPEWGELMVGWAVRVPEKFVEALRNGDPAAMTILAYWAASFYPANERWWATGWSAALILEVSGAVAEPWRGLVGWAREYAGLPA